MDNTLFFFIFRPLADELWKEIEDEVLLSSQDFDGKIKIPSTFQEILAKLELAEVSVRLTFLCYIVITHITIKTYFTTTVLFFIVQLIIYCPESFGFLRIIRVRSSKAYKQILRIVRHCRNFGQKQLPKLYRAFKQSIGKILER